MNQSDRSLHTEYRTAMSFRLEDKRILSYSKYGQPGGYPIVMLHGTPGSRISWEEALYHQLGIEIIYPERPGYGNSSPNPKASFSSWADDVIALLDHLQLDKVDIGGVSGGGAFTMACVAYQPDRFKSATLISSAAPPQTPNYKKGMALANRLGFWISRNVPFLMRWASKNFANNYKKNPEAIWDKITKQLCQSDQDIINNAKKNGLYQVYVDHLAEAFKNGVEGHIADMKSIAGPWNIPFENIQCPIYIWHGEADTLSPIAGAKALANWLPNTTTYFLPSYGHLLAEDENTLNRILSKILQG